MMGVTLGPGWSIWGKWGSYWARPYWGDWGLAALGCPWGQGVLECPQDQGALRCPQGTGIVPGDGVALRVPMGQGALGCPQGTECPQVSPEVRSPGVSSGIRVTWDTPGDQMP